MPMRLVHEVDRLKKMILTLAARVEENVRNAVAAVARRDDKLAAQVIDTDREIDAAEVDVEEECLKILALYQPVAHDLRYIVAILKINHDLERIGDLSVSIAERARDLSRMDPPSLDFDLMKLAENAQAMVGRSIDALIHVDLNLAREIWLSDDDIDRHNERIFAEAAAEIRRNPAQIEPMLALLSVSRNLERIADHATNIAKDVIYMVEGEIVRHRARDMRKRMAEGS